MKNKKMLARLMLSLVAVVVVLSTLLATVTLSTNKESAPSGSGITKLDGSINTNMSDYLNGSVVYQLPDNVKDTDIISVIVQVTENNLLDAYRASGSELSFTEYASSEEADEIRRKIAEEKADLIASLDGAEVNYGLGASYSAILSGFEITIQAGDFETVCKTFGNRATTIVGEVYNVAETQLVENKVDVYDTGIFDSSDSKYDGSGVVVAVLDTGLDYYHTAFSTQNFTSGKLGMTFSDVAGLVDETRAAGFVSGLTASDVYISEKVPYAFDYADKDSDVFPISSDHGTHVAGVIAGKDDVITGVAPNAQLVIMKTFSDIEDSARSSWILSALEDCVVLGVDVINMSLGTACGFSRESDKEAISGVYDRIRETGISLVVAASNSFSSAYASEKNGNLGLTTNPDTATVGSPGTYEAALSVASINGAKTPYLLYNGSIIYYIESSDRVSEEKNFFDDILPEGVNEQDFEFVTIPGAGRSADYTGIDVTGKIALVRRGSTTFEEKANVAESKGAIGVIIYNNVSGDIKMNVGDTKIAVCSIPQDDGELMAAAGTGTIKISRSQTSGPFMSDFSSWGPTPDLGIKPEITAHGGEILSAVPGQSYDRISGTSMACPNVAGLTALLRQYVMENLSHIAGDPVEVNACVNRLMMSTADIVINTNGLPYAVRKQGAGLANLDNATKTAAYIMTYDRTDGTLQAKSKIELGDDPTKSGVYNLKFSIKNFGTSDLSYDLSTYVMTEGVSDTKTNDGKTTVTEQGYLLSGATTAITSLVNGTQNGNRITVAAGQTADVVVTITLSDSDKAYLDASFANGMYVEGFVVLNNINEEDVDLSVPYLAFYGDWSVAPIFDLDYYATNKDELDDSIDLLDKTLPDAYATRPIGGIEDDYVSYLGSYYFEQDPSSKLISASRDYISLSNQTGSVHSLRFVWAGLLRNAARIEITITEDATGEVVFTHTENDVRKSYGDGGSIYPANIDIEFDAAEQNLKNNTKYTVKLKGYLDYENDGADTNLSNTFEFPLVTDFEAPTVTGCEFYTEYDKSLKKTRLYAKVAVYDNHYAMSAMFGYVGLDSAGTGFMLNGFDKYMTQVYSEFNSTTYVVYELTDYINDIRTKATNKNTFTVACYDYALNEATYEIELPDEFLDFYFAEAENGLTLSPNEVYTLTPLAYPGTEWTELLTYYSTNMNVATVVNNKLVAIKKGTTQIIAEDPTTKKQARFTLTVLGEGDEGYVKYDKPVADIFELTGYLVNKAYYQLSSEDREIGTTGDEMKFASSNNYSLSMYPSESVTLRYRLDAYFPKNTTVTFESSNESIVKVDENGTITAVGEGFGSIAVRVLLDGKSTYYSQSISITVKDPYITTGPSLTHYFGNGGRVHIPPTLAITEIGQYAFANFDYIPKEEGDEISEEDPEFTKIWYLGDDSIEEVIIPEGVEKIGAYAFANLTKLRSVTLPSTLTTIAQGAFYGCTSLTEIKGIENVKFINQNAFAGCNLSGTLSLNNAAAIADFAFAYNKNLESVTLPVSTQSVGAYAFAGNTALKSVTINADKVKLGKYAFQSCSSLTSISINAAVIPTGAFDGCSKLTSVTIGKDVAVIGEYAFRNAGVTSFTVAEGNTTFRAQNSGQYLLNAAGDTLLLAAPGITGAFAPSNASGITAIGNGAFSGNPLLTSVTLTGVKSVGNYAFADCTLLKTVNLGTPESIGDYAFYGTRMDVAPSFNSLNAIGKYAFANTHLSAVSIPNGITVGEGAFKNCKRLASVTVGDNVTLEKDAFYLNYLENWTYSSYKDTAMDRDLYYYVFTSPLHSLTIGKNVKIGNGAFYGAAELESVTLGEGAVIGDDAFYAASKLTDIDLSKVVSIGKNAFSGPIFYEYLESGFANTALDAEGYYIYRYYAPAFTSVSLSAATAIGENAFAYCRDLTEVTLGNGVKAIPDGAFLGCIALERINLSEVTSIGGSAFSETALTSVDLSSAETVGEYAFTQNESLTKVTLNNAGVKIGEGAFAYCYALRTVENLNRVTEIGDYGFAYTALTSADLTAAASIGAHAFLKEAPTEFAVTLGTGLSYLGDNPFAMCILTPFSSTVTESFNGKDYHNTVYTYDLNESIRVIDGSLYRVVPNGLELITYTASPDGNDSATVANDTVRISAMAFAGTDVVKVVLPYTVASIGHKAFYACEDLVLVSFSSYDAPILEEEYDEIYYMSAENLPATGEFEFETVNGVETRQGLGIVPYFMWNVSATPSNVFYGANFVNYIGRTDGNVVMVRPTNGQNYDSFIFSQYFNLVLDGEAAADDITLAAIAAVNRLPETVTLADKALVEAARAAYDKIASTEQRALYEKGGYYEKLSKAEQRIKDLEYLQNQNTEPAPEPKPVDEKLAVWQIVLIVAGGVILAAAIAVAVILFLRKKKNGTPKDPDGPEGDVPEKDALPTEAASEAEATDAEEPGAEAAEEDAANEPETDSAEQSAEPSGGEGSEENSDGDSDSTKNFGGNE